MQPDPYNLNRFLTAQEPIIQDVLSELKNGHKQSHWMWFIFPQIDGLGFSSTTRYYAIKNLYEARQYLHHPILGSRLLQCAKLALAVEGKSALEIFGSPDDMKLKSCLTLFARVPGADPLFRQLLEKYYLGHPDERTIDLLGG